MIVSCLKLVRYPNLIIMLVLQLAMHACVVKPLLYTFTVAPTTPGLLFWLQAVGLILIAAGGYVINDYFDTQIDAINRPDRVIVGTVVSKKGAMRLYQILSLAGLGACIAVAVFARSATLGFLYVAFVGLLWFYSASYKRQFVVGNVIVALCAAFGPFIVGYQEIAFLHLQYGELLAFTPVPKILMSWIGGFAAFAFLLTWIREIIKDMEDIQGDRELECHTMPVKWGLRRTRVFIYLLMAITLLLGYLAVNHIHFVNDSITMRYYLFAMVVPFLFLAYLVAVAKQPAAFRQAATFTKVIMLAGIGYSLVFYFLEARANGFPIFGLFMITQ
jgi:4-hydroxybenzoate polyprenyltransferase